MESYKNKITQCRIAEAKQLWQNMQPWTSSFSQIINRMLLQFTLRSSLYAVPVYLRSGFKECGPVASKDGISFQVMELN